MSSIQIHWTKCNNYNQAKDFTGVIYVHCWGNEPFYWGKAHNSFFGGSSRLNKKGVKISGRYSSSYRHWIEACLKHGAKLYIGQLDSKGQEVIDEIENYLINWFPSTMNKRFTPISHDIPLIHSGDIPLFIRKKKSKVKNQGRFIEYSEFGKRLTSVMDMVSMTQLRLSQISNITQPQIYYYRSGKTSPKLYIVQKLAFLLGVDYNWLKNGNGELKIYNENYPEDQFFKTFPERLCFLIWTKGLSIEQLASEINQSNSSILYWLEGERNPNEESVSKLCAFFKVSEMWLVEGK